MFFSNLRNLRDLGSGIRDLGSGIWDQGSGIREHQSGNRDQDTGNKKLCSYLWLTVIMQRALDGFYLQEMLTGVMGFI